ncbi:LysR substrate-binding domain-containing protein [Ancylobacter lacus]|uniref:LysR substrate-binding domain-containing protein n=1 Tax=Ancylobacter lacus TaxID=2579970 RepID=UPI001BD067B7|nr:LysR substrate-binding domain-containing protein [Ancylobacter lacus]MBS7538192.1 LysR family transcriptional regulator [Ancylobacter lacus]
MTAPSKDRPLPPLNAIRAFEAAARRSSFKDAAAELGVTHGAVSRQIRLLEEWLGPPLLFRRMSHGVALTAEGRALFADIQPALERIAGAAARHGREAGGTVVLRVNALATFSLRWLVPKLGRLREAHPDIEIELTTGNEPVDGLAGDYDLIIRGGPDAFHGFEARLLLPERRLPACSAALLQRQPLEEVADLARHTLLHVASMPRLWRDWLAKAGQGSLEPAATLMLDHFYLSIQAAVDGLGVAMAPSALIEDDLRAGRLVTPFPHIWLPSRSYFAYTPLDSPLRAASDRVCAWIGGPDGASASPMPNGSV